MDKIDLFFRKLKEFYEPKPAPKKPTLKKPAPKKSVPRNRAFKQPINRGGQSIEELLARNDGQYITFLKERSNSNLYGALRKSLNATSATPLDQFVNAMCFRAEAVNEGFITLAKAGNFLSACSMIRLQLDSALICLAGLKAKNQFEFFVAFNSGTPINKLKDQEGNLLTQNYLVKSFDNPEIKAIFDNGNRYVHPSRLFQDESIDLTDGLRLMDYREYQVPDKIRKEAYRQMVIANNLLAKYLHEWIKIKNSDSCGR